MKGAIVLYLPLAPRLIFYTLLDLCLGMRSCRAPTHKILHKILHEILQSSDAELNACGRSLRGAGYLVPGTLLYASPSTALPHLFPAEFQRECGLVQQALEGDLNKVDWILVMSHVVVCLLKFHIYVCLYNWQ